MSKSQDLEDAMEACQSKVIDLVVTHTHISLLSIIVHALCTRSTILIYMYAIEQLLERSMFDSWL